MQAFVYMWHPQAIDTFDNYFGTLSTFVDTQEEDFWTTSITLTYWDFESPIYLLEPKSGPSSKSRYIEPRQRGQFPPPNVRMLRVDDKRSSDSRGAKGSIEERSSAIVITGDSRGNLWTCSIWSSLLDDDQIPVPMIEELLNLFKHQPSTARSLAYLLILGLLCERLASRIEDALDSLGNYIELGVSLIPLHH